MLYFACQQPGTGVLDGGGRCLSKADSPPMDNQWVRAFIDRGRGSHAETVQSALTIILKLAIGGLISVILIVLGTVNLQFQFHFFEANSQNCGSLCHGYSLIIMKLTSPTWWGFQDL